MKEYERLRAALLERRVDRHARWAACVAFAIAMAFLVKLTRHQEGTPAYLEWLSLSVFALVGSGVLAAFAAVLQAARVIIGELERVKVARPESDTLNESVVT